MAQTPRTTLLVGLLVLIVFFAVVSLCVKPAGIVLPLVLLLLDRLEGRRWDRAAVLEKLPFFLIAAAFGIFGLWAIRGGAWQHTLRWRPESIFRASYNILFMCSTPYFPFVYRVFIRRIR